MNTPFPFSETGSLILESALALPGARHSIVASGPQKILSGDAETLWKELDQTWQEPASNPEAPFSGGWIGFIGYEAATLMDPRLPSRPAELTPLFWFGYYDQVRILEPSAVVPGPPVTLQSLEGFEDYRRAFEKVQNYIHSGDVYQVNLAVRFTQPVSEEPWALYRKLCALSPAPYAAFLNLGDRHILSSSPECFFRLDGDAIVTCPIKGTRPRGRTPEEDARLRQALLENPKDRAELLMITDLERNDLGKVCVPGSIRVHPLSEIIHLPQVHHQQSRIEGRLRKDLRISDVIKALFPGGSITGAPKKRAMEIIRELEPQARDVYCGSIGYVSRGRKAAFNIAIRTLVLHQGAASFWSGSGLVADSEAALEWAEIEAKASGMLAALK